MKTLVSSFVAKDAVVVLASAFNAICVSKVLVSSLSAKVAFVVFKSLKSAFKAIPASYVVVSNFTVNPASTCVFV